MKLSDLNPKWEIRDNYRFLAFDCPVCRDHRIEVPVDDHPKAWQLSAIQPIEEMFNTPDWDQLTLNPSIDHKTQYARSTDTEPKECHSHFYIRPGLIQIL